MPPTSPAQVLLGLIRGASFGPPIAAADEVGADVGRPDDEQQPEDVRARRRRRAARAAPGPAGRRRATPPATWLDRRSRHAAPRSRPPRRSPAAAATTPRADRRTPASQERATAGNGGRGEHEAEAARRGQPRPLPGHQDDRDQQQRGERPAADQRRAGPPPARARGRPRTRCGKRRIERASQRKRHSAARGGGTRHRLLQMLARRSRATAYRDEDQLGVGALPEQEIADALLAAGADQQVGVGHAARSASCAANRVSSIASGSSSPRLRLAREPPRRLDDLLRGAVVERMITIEPLVVAACAPRPPRSCARMSGGRPARSPMTRSRTPLRCSSVDLAAQVVAQQAHQVADLVGRPAPVLGREGEQRQVPDALARAGLDRAPHRLGAAPVAGDRRQAAARAQRPLPSMMIATCAGGGGGDRVLMQGSAGTRMRHQTVQDLLFLVRQHLVDRLDVLVGQLLHLVGLLRARPARCRGPSPAASAGPCRRGGRCGPRPGPARRICARPWPARCAAPAVSSGSGMRSIWPSAAGLRPRPASRIALSTALTRPRSQTWTVSIRGSGTLTVPTWLSGISLAVGLDRRPARAGSATPGRCAGPQLLAQHVERAVHALARDREIEALAAHASALLGDDGVGALARAGLGERAWLVDARTR